MSRTRILYSHITGRKMAEFKNGDLVWQSEEYERPIQSDYFVQGDIQPYVSMIDGSVINSRATHREHLRQHNCVEVGNDSSLRATAKPLQSPPGLKEDIIRATNAVLERRR